ncbi:unnamed protein product [[Candida] boidinii]|uniref:Unnamed protein product n=1 Tax=Candida boidinii TaxID=5477 RepID=A0A9W6WL32_CANBO|nr:unnamed protein product [[Candida] boidinii]
MDPKEKEKSEVANFIQSMIEELERQDESIEAQIDQIQSSMKKGKRSNNDSIKQQVSELQEFTESHKFHLEKLENILRLLENGSIEPEQIKKLQEDIQYYVESNQDDDFFEDDTIYDELGLDELDDAFIPLRQQLQHQHQRPYLYHHLLQLQTSKLPPLPARQL